MPASPWVFIYGALSSRFLRRTKHNEMRVLKDCDSEKNIYTRIIVKRRNPIIVPIIVSEDTFQVKVLFFWPDPSYFFQTIMRNVRSIKMSQKIGAFLTFFKSPHDFLPLQSKSRLLTKALRARKIGKRRLPKIDHIAVVSMSNVNVLDRSMQIAILRTFSVAQPDTPRTDTQRIRRRRKNAQLLKPDTLLPTSPPL